ncbi:MAG: GNAT family N-acetyltransferase [Candidatus Neomarinimicrobiota bacterium]|jgi:hypothetical protein|nr:GNAT family N-acetyltransferase [Candidatus Neomarinimicrobiota bacterium]
MLKIYKNKIPNLNDEKLPFNLKTKFLKCFQNSNLNIDNVLILNNKSILFSNILNIKLVNGLDYNNLNFLVKFFLKFVKIRVFFFGNWYLNNIPSIEPRDSFDFKEIDLSIINKCSAKIIPDQLFSKVINCDENEFIKLRIEDDMVFHVNTKWKTFDDYLNSLKAKYRKKVQNIYKKSKSLECKIIKSDYFFEHKKKFQDLFDQIITNSKFHGPELNVDVLYQLLKNNILFVYGYFFNDKLLGFNSYIIDNEHFISYFIGYDRRQNKDYSIYPRMLIDKIKFAINLKMKKIIFGRTANEFKSNFGALPIKSDVFIKFNNKIIHKIFHYILKNTKIKKWKKRNPFKKEFLLTELNDISFNINKLNKELKKS